MKKTPANKGKTCIRRKRGSDGKMRCAAFGKGPAKKAGTKRRSKAVARD